MQPTSRTIPSLLLAILAALTLPVLAQADTHLTLKRDADEFVGMNGRSSGGKNQKVTVWIGADRASRDDGRSAAILRLDLGRLCLVDHASKTFTVLELKKAGDSWMIQSKLRDFEQTKELQDLARRTAAVTPKPESRRQVGSWKASLTQVAVVSQMSGGTDIGWWTTAEPKLADRPYRELLVLLAGMSPMSPDTTWLKTIVDLPGTPVYVEILNKLPDAVAKTAEELKGLEEKEAPAGLYDPPSDYKPLDPVTYLKQNGYPDVP